MATHYSVDDSYLLIATTNDNTQGSGGTPTYIKLPVTYDAEAAFEPEDVITDDDIATGDAAPIQSDLNYGYKSLKVGIWPNAKELHHLIVWALQDVPPHTAPITHLYGTGLANSRQIIYFNGYEAKGFYAIVASFDFKTARKGKAMVDLDLACLDGPGTLPDPLPGRCSLGPSLWRKHVGLGLFGGTGVLTSFGIKIGRELYAVPPPFLGSGHLPEQFDFNGRWDCAMSGEGYLPGFDPIDAMENDTAYDGATAFNVTDGVNSFDMSFGNVKVTSGGDKNENGSRGFKVESKVFKNATTSMFMSLGAIS